MNTKTLLGLVLVLTLLVMSRARASGADDWIWHDGFEDGEPLSSKYEDVGANGLSISVADAFAGDHSVEQHYDQGQIGAGWLIKVDDDGFPDHIFVRWYHKFEEGFEGFPPKMARVRYRPRSGPGAWQTVFAVHFWIEDARIVADVLAENSSQANSSGWLPIAYSDFYLSDPANLGRWICFEMEVKLNTPGEADGLYRFWADDELIIERTNVDLRGSTNDKINEVMLDCYWNGGSPKAQSRYYDEFVISTSKIGPIDSTSDAVTDLRAVRAITAAQTFTVTLAWTAPARAVTYTLGYSDTLIAEAGWASAVTFTAPFTASPTGHAEWITTTVPYSGNVVYFALKSQSAGGDWSDLSNVAFWPCSRVYLPLVTNED